MRMDGKQEVAAERHAVWQALNDPVILAQCIPGCQSLTRDGSDSFAAVAEVKIGPIGARFKGDVRLSDLDAPNGYTITGTGNGGIAGSAKGEAKVRLADLGGGRTMITYTVDAEVGGRMAQLGGPIIDATARNLAAKFFSRFEEVLTEGPADHRIAEPAVGVHTGPAAQPASGSVPGPTPGLASPSRAPWAWVAALVLTLTAGFVLGAAHVQSEFIVVLVMLVVTAAAAFEAGRRGAMR